MDLSFEKSDKLVELLKNGQIGVMPTDTIYGIVGSALNPRTVEEIYALRKRASDKPMIILTSSLEDLKKFDIILTTAQINFLKKIWPNPVSVILPCIQERFSYLHRGKKSLAFRVPKNTELLRILRKVGPLVAPSANFEKEKPLETVSETRKHFGDKVAFYIDGGILKSKPSTIIRLYKDGARIVVRQGNFVIGDDFSLNRSHKA